MIAANTIHRDAANRLKSVDEALAQLVATTRTVGLVIGVSYNGFPVHHFNYGPCQTGQTNKIEVVGNDLDRSSVKSFAISDRTADSTPSFRFSFENGQGTTARTSKQSRVSNLPRFHWSKISATLTPLETEIWASETSRFEESQITDQPETEGDIGIALSPWDETSFFHSQSPSKLGESPKNFHSSPVSDQPYNSSTIFPIGDLTQIFLSAILVQLVSEGKLSWDAKVSQYIPQLSGTREAKIKLGDLEFTAPESQGRDQNVYQSGIGKSIYDRITLHELVSHTFDPPSDTKAGIGVPDFSVLDKVKFLDLIKTFAENSKCSSLYSHHESWRPRRITYALVGLIISTAIGGKEGTWFDILRDKLLDDLGLARTTVSAKGSGHLQVLGNFTAGYQVVSDGTSRRLVDLTYGDAGSIFSPSHGLWSCVDDLLEWGSFLLTNQDTPLGQTFDDHCTLPPIHSLSQGDQWLSLGGWVKSNASTQSLTHGSPNTKVCLPYFPSGGKDGVWKGQKIPAVTTLRRGSTGFNHQSNITLIPDYDIVIVTLSNTNCWTDVADLASLLILQDLFQLSPWVDIHFLAHHIVQLPERWFEGVLLKAWVEGRNLPKFFWSYRKRDAIRCVKELKALTGTFYSAELDRKVRITAHPDFLAAVEPFPEDIIALESTIISPFKVRKLGLKSNDNSNRVDITGVTSPLSYLMEQAKVKKEKVRRASWSYTGSGVAYKLLSEVHKKPSLREMEFFDRRSLPLFPQDARERFFDRRSKEKIGSDPEEIKASFMKVNKSDGDVDYLYARMEALLEFDPDYNLAPGQHSLSGRSDEQAAFCQTLQIRPYNHSYALDSNPCHSGSGSLFESMEIWSFMPLDFNEFRAKVPHIETLGEGLMLVNRSALDSSVSDIRLRIGNQFFPFHKLKEHKPTSGSLYAAGNKKWRNSSILDRCANLRLERIGGKWVNHDDPAKPEYTSQETKTPTSATFVGPTDIVEQVLWV
jgi:CubicO group peptidase (beta-lactamase class C family)